MKLASKLVMYGLAALYLFNAIVANGALATLSWLLGAGIVATLPPSFYFQGYADGIARRGKHWSTTDGRFTQATPEATPEGEPDHH